MTRLRVAYIIYCYVGWAAIGMWVARKLAFQDQRLDEIEDVVWTGDDGVSIADRLQSLAVGS